LISQVSEGVHKVTGKHCAVKIIDKATIEPDEKALLRTEIVGMSLILFFIELFVVC